MKRILSLLFISSSVFSMQLDIVQRNRQELGIVQRDKQMFEVALLKQKSHKINDLDKVYIAQQSVFVPNQLGSIELSHGKKGFCVHKDGKKHFVKRYNVDPMARDFTKEQLQSFLAVGYFCVNKMSNDEYSLKANARINGGGVFGASLGAFLGKAAVYVVGHGAIQIVAVLTGPAYPVTVMALEGCFAAPIEAASMAGAVAGGLALGVATGPV